MSILVFSGQIPDDALKPDPDKLAHWVKDDLGDRPAIGSVLAKINHTILMAFAVEAAQSLQSHGATAQFIAPGDSTRYCASVIDTRWPELVSSSERDGPRERYIFSFGTDARVGRQELNFDSPPYLPSDCETMSNGSAWTQVVCWVWINYLHHARTGLHHARTGPSQKYPWLA